MPFRFAVRLLYEIRRASDGSPGGKPEKRQINFIPASVQGNLEKTMHVIPDFVSIVQKRSAFY
jgi:hypothetical protein